LTSKWTWECKNCRGNAMIPDEDREYQPCLMPSLCVTFNPDGLSRDQLDFVAASMLGITTK
jgi:hypothetical protein